MMRARVTVALWVTLMAGSARAQQPRSQPVCRPGFLRGSDGCVRASEPATAVFATEDSSDHFSVVLETRSGPLRCADVTNSRSCALRLEPQELHVRVGGDASFSSTITVPRGGTVFRIETRGYALLITGLTMLAVSGAVAGIGAAREDLGMTGVGLFMGVLSVLIGGPLILVDLFRYHSRITSVPLPGPSVQDRTSALFPRETASGYAVTPILSTPLLRF